MLLGLVLCLLSSTCDCWTLAPANCDFVCCLAGLSLPLPLCVSPEEARLQRWGRVACSGTHCLVARLHYEEELPPTSPPNPKIMLPPEDDPDAVDPCPNVKTPLTADIGGLPNLPRITARRRSRRDASRKKDRKGPPPDLAKIKGKKISRNIILKGETRSKKKKAKRLSAAIDSVRKTFGSKSPKNESNSLELEGDFDHLFKDASIEPGSVLAGGLASSWVEVKYRIHSIVKFNLRQIKFSAGIELIWTDSQLTLCDCTGGNHTGPTEMDSGDLHRWVWTPDFFNWLHKSWSNHGVGLRDQSHQLRISAAEDGVRMSQSSVATISTPCGRNMTWWPYDVATCHFLGGSYSWGAWLLGSYTSEIDTSDLKANLGGFTFRVYKTPLVDSILVDADDAYILSGIKFVAIRVNPGVVLGRITMALETLVVVSLGTLCLPSIHPHAEGLGVDRCTALAGLMIIYVYVYQFVFDEIPDSAGGHVTDIVLYYWVFAGLAPAQTCLMGLIANGWSVNCRKLVDITFFVVCLLAFAYFKGYIVADMGAEITRDSCYQRVIAGNLKELI